MKLLALAALALCLSACAVNVPLGPEAKYGMVTVAYRLPEQAAVYGGGK